MIIFPLLMKCNDIIVNQHIFHIRQQAEDSTDSKARHSNAVVKVKLIDYGADLSPCMMSV
ncbi:hypothetical protein BWD07_08690 [Neisseria canis]|nr:hypothetical protein BWD07_08690 [Neisseria canis]